MPGSLCLFAGTVLDILSLEESRSLRCLVRGEPHTTAVRKYFEWAGEGAAFVEWKKTDGKVDWEEAERRLESPTFYYRK